LDFSLALFLKVEKKKEITSKLNIILTFFFNEPDREDDYEILSKESDKDKNIQVIKITDLKCFMGKQNFELFDKVLKKEVDNINFMEKIQPMESKLINIESKKEDVKEWFQTYNGGKFAQLAQYFEGIDGEALLRYTEQQLFNYLTRKGVDELAIYDLFNVLHQ